MDWERILGFLYTGLYIAAAGGFAALAVLSGREDAPRYARDSPLMRPFRKMSVFLYRRFCGYRDRRRRKGKDLFVPGEEGVRSDLSILYPSLKARRQELRYRLEQIERILLLLFGGVLLAGIVHAGALRSGRLRQDGSIERAPSGGEDVQIRVTALPEDLQGAFSDSPAAARQARREADSQAGVSVGEEAGETAGSGAGESAGEEAEEGVGGQAGPDGETRRDFGTYEVTVHARELTRQEAAARAEEIFRAMPKAVLGENADPGEIRFPLRLPSRGEVEPFSISYESSRYSVMDTDGSVYNSEYGEDQREDVELTAILSYGDYLFEKKLPFTVCAPVRDPEEQLRGRIEAALRDAERNSASGEAFFLPREAAGLSLSWREKAEDVSPAVLVLCAAACMLAFYVMDYRLHERTKVRARQLAIDYPQLTSRMVLYLGAGMSVRNVFYKCAADYQARRAAAGEKKGRALGGGGAESCEGGRRYLYEEIQLVCNEMDTGIPEADAYMRFGRRCRSRQYTKLCSLLVQNLRRGNDTLLAVLQEEAKSSFEERKNLARELGEEAGTKLLLPMMIMLTITMLLIIVPAYFGFSM